MNTVERKIRIQGILGSLMEGAYNLPKTSMAMQNGPAFLGSAKTPRSIDKIGEALVRCATVDGCAGLLKDLLEAGISPDAPNRQGQFPLYLATLCGHPGVAHLLLGAGADKDRAFCAAPGDDLASEEDGNTPLLAAAHQGHLDTLRVLIEAGANLEKRNSFGGTPMFEVVKEGHTECVQALTEAGAKVKITVHRWTPLSIASHSGFLGVVRTLLAAGADPTEGLATAAQNDHREIVRILVEAGANVEQIDPYVKGTPMTVAATYGRRGVVELLLAAGADKDADCYGKTPMYCSSIFGFLDVVRILVEKGAAIDGAPALATGTPLAAACVGDGMPVVRYLMEAGADPSARCNGQTPLSEAASRGNCGVVDYLLKHGARDPNLTVRPENLSST